MNEKGEFIKELKRQLVILHIHNNVINEIITDIEQHFVLSKSDGKSEDDVIESLGNPYDLAKEYLWLNELTERKESKISIYISIIRMMPEVTGRVIFQLFIDILLVMLFIVGVMIVISGGLCIVGAICSFANVEGVIFESFANIWVTRIVAIILGIVFIHYGYKFVKYLLKKIGNSNKRFTRGLRKKILVDK